MPSVVINNAKFFCMASSGGKFCIVAPFSSVCAMSNDGITWTLQSLPSAACWMAMGASEVYFVAIIYNVNQGIRGSLGGTTWSSFTYSGGSSSSSPKISFGPSGFLFAPAGASNVMFFSADGINWATKNIPTSGLYVTAAG
jgi:hypothetical protein